MSHQEFERTSEAHPVVDFLEPLNDYTRTVVKRFGQVLSITGTAFDEDYDGAFSRTPPRSLSFDFVFKAPSFYVKLVCRGGM